MILSHSCDESQEDLPILDGNKEKQWQNPEEYHMIRELVAGPPILWTGLGLKKLSVLFR